MVTINLSDFDHSGNLDVIERNVLLVSAVFLEPKTSEARPGFSEFLKDAVDIICSTITKYPDSDVIV